MRNVWITETVMYEDGYCDEQTEPESLNLSVISGTELWKELNTRMWLSQHLIVSESDIRQWLEDAVANYSTVTTCLTIAKIPDQDATIDVDLHYGTEADAEFGAEALASEPEMEQLDLIDYLEGVS